MTMLKKRLNFSLLFVHQLRMHYVFQDVDLKVYYIFRGLFGGPFQAAYPVTFFADKLIYTGWAFSLEDKKVRAFHNFDGKSLAYGTIYFI